MQVCFHLFKDIKDNDEQAFDKKERFTVQLEKVNQTIKDCISQQTDIKQLRSSLNEVKGLMGTDLQALVTVEKIYIAQEQITKIGMEVERIEQDYIALKRLCDNLREDTGDGVELVEEFKEILEALREDKAEIKNSFDRQGASIKDLEKMVEEMQKSLYYKDQTLFDQLTYQIELLKELKSSKVEMVSNFINEIDVKSKKKASITVKGKRDKSFAAEQLAEVQLLANRREQIRLDYSKLKEDLREGKEEIIKLIDLPLAVTKMQEFYGSMFNPKEMKTDVEFASCNLNFALRDGQIAQQVVKALTHAKLVSIACKYKLIENQRDAIITQIEEVSNNIDRRVGEMEQYVPDDQVLQQSKSNHKKFLEQFEKFKQGITSKIEGYPQSKQEIPDWYKKQEKLEGRIKVFEGLLNLFMQILESVEEVKKPKPVEILKVEKIQTQDSADFQPDLTPINGTMDYLIKEMQDKIDAKLTLQLIDEEKNLYLFGTRKVVAKVINGHLMVRVGGGYMGFKEFYNTYSAPEREKLIKMEERKEDATVSTSPDSKKGKKKKKKKKGHKKINIELRSSLVLQNNIPIGESTTYNFEEQDSEDEEDEMNQTLPFNEGTLISNESVKLIV